jgi:hypothetical protein
MARDLSLEHLKKKQKTLFLRFQVKRMIEYRKYEIGDRVTTYDPKNFEPQEGTVISEATRETRSNVFDTVLYTHSFDVYTVRSDEGDEFNMVVPVPKEIV